MMNSIIGDANLMKYSRGNQLFIIINLICLMSFNLFLNEVDATPTLAISFEEKSHIYSSQDSFAQCKIIGDNLFTISVPRGPKSYDISDIEQPILLDGFYDQHLSHHFQIQNDLLFLADGDFGIQIYNISNPSNLQLITEFSPHEDGLFINICIYNNLLITSDYRASLGYMTLLFINITDPTNPSIISSVSDGISYYLRCIVDNDLCYATSYNNGLKIYNISNLESINEIYHYNELMAPFDIMKSDDLIYLGDFNYFRILNVSNLNSISIIGEYYTPNDIMDINIFNSLAIISERDSCLSILDISIPSNPRKIGQFDVDIIGSCEIDDQYLYVALDNNGIKILSYDVTTIPTSLSYSVNIFEILVICSIIIPAIRFLSKKYSKKI